MRPKSPDNSAINACQLLNVLIGEWHNFSFLVLDVTNWQVCVNRQMQSGYKTSVILILHFFLLANICQSEKDIILGPTVWGTPKY